MNTVLTVLWAILGFLGLVVALTAAKVSVSVLSDEVKGWIGRIPHGLLVLAARRLPAGFRDDQLVGRQGELVEILEGTNVDDRPVSRLFVGLRYGPVPRDSLARAFGYEPAGDTRKRVWCNERRRIPV